MTALTKDQERAWSVIEEVDRPEGWCECDHCGGKLFSVMSLPAGRTRLACLRCMQRYDYKAIPPYAGYGSF
ncbi:MAG: hypothetical protein WKG03_16700 [Telluria sp.]